MRKFFISLYITFGFLVGLLLISGNTSAQMTISCGDIIEGEFLQDQELHEYEITSETGDRLVIYAYFIPESYKELQIDTGVRFADGRWLDRLTGYRNGTGYVGDTDPSVETLALPENGSYSIAVRGFTSTGGRYRLFLACTRSNGDVIGAGYRYVGVECGSIVSNTIVGDREVHRYYVNIQRGTMVSVSAEASPASYEEIRIDVGLRDPNDRWLDEMTGYRNGTGYVGDVRNNFETQDLPYDGLYLIGLRGFTTTGSAYTLYIECTLPDGTRVPAGTGTSIELSPESLDTSNLISGVVQFGSETLPETPTSDEPTALTEFDGYGFPGLSPVDFTNVAQIPIPAGIPMSGAVAADGSQIIGYQFDANEGDTVELAFNRLSGNLNLGLVVIDENSNVVYQASLVTTATMTARFTVPTTGTYTAGVFRIDLLPPDAPETTAFQLIATVNP